MSRLPQDLSRRIDRLSRRAHIFHRFAHHPLCKPYHPEVLRFGRRFYLCRGCTYTAAGYVTGLTSGLWLSPPSAGELLAGVALFAMACSMAFAKRASKLRSKLLSRFAPAALGGAISGGLGAHQLFGAGCALAAMAVAVLAFQFYRRRGPDRAPCLTCPDRDQRKTCPGLSPIARREAAFRRLAGRWIRAADISGRASSASYPFHTR